MKRLFYLCIVLLLAAHSGCKSKQKNDNSTKPSTQTSTPKRKVTDAECESMAKQIQTCLDNKDLSGLENLYDVNLLMDRVLDRIPASNPARRAYRESYVKKTAGNGGLLKILVEHLELGAFVSCVRIEDTDSDKALLYRLVMPNDTIMYMEFALAPNSQDAAKIADMFLFVGGFRMSELLQPHAFRLAARADPKFAQSLSADERLQQQFRGDIMSMTKSLESQKFENVLTIYNRLPDQVKKRKDVMLTTINAAAQMEDRETLLSLFEILFETYSGEKWIHQLKWMHSDNNAEILESINKLDEAIGGDPFLDYYRSEIALEEKDYAKALTLCEAAAAAEPEMLDPSYLKLSILLAKQDNPAILEMLKEVHSYSDTEWSKMKDDPEYSNFIKTDEYKAWLAYLEAEQSEDDQVPD